MPVDWRTELPAMPHDHAGSNDLMIAVQWVIEAADASGDVPVEWILNRVERVEAAGAGAIVAGIASPRMPSRG